MALNRYGKIWSYINSIWFFPAIATFILILLTLFQISGSSIGIYHTYFYGDQTDPELLLNQPESIRSDEYVVNTQKAIAQKNNNFAPINDNFGNGEDATVLGEMPYADWSIIFKPQNLGFFVLPFDNAFALRWWIMPYFIVLGCYFFVLAILPKRKKIAILLSVSFLLSPFVHWWYIPSALATIYYSFFGMTVFIKLLQSKKQVHSALWSLLLAYIAAAYILILYPPFQIPCGLIIIAFIIGYTLNNKQFISGKYLKNNLIFAGIAALIAIAIAGLFLYQKKQTVETLQNTVYPGQRIVESGGFSMAHFLSSDLSPIFQDKVRADTYSRPGQTNAVNQSESSNFILIFPFLLFPLGYLFYKRYRHTKKIDYLLVCTTAILVVFMTWMFVPGLDVFGKLTLLERVPQSRLVIGFGLLNLIFMVLFIQNYSAYKKYFNLRLTLIYTLSILALYLFINFRVASAFPLFIGTKSVIALSFVIPVILFLMMRKYFTWAILALLVFSFLSVYKINPIYQGTEILTDTPLSKAIKSTEPSSQKKWISEDIILENFAAMNGRPSLTGVHIYPQLKLWDGLNQTDKRDTYNRYSHVNFTFNRDSNDKPLLRSPSADQFNVKISPCDPFFKQNDVGFLITSVKFKTGVNTCARLIQEVEYPKLQFYIYKISF